MIHGGIDVKMVQSERKRLHDCGKCDRQSNVTFSDSAKEKRFADLDFYVLNGLGYPSFFHASIVHK